MATKSITTRRIKKNDRRNKLIFCACGCGRRLWKYKYYFCPSINKEIRKPRRFIKGHNVLKGVPRTGKVRKKVSQSLKKWHKEVGHSEETKEKIRQTLLKQRDEISRKMRGKRNPMYGKDFSKEHRRKIGMASKGENASNWKGDKIGVKPLHRWVRNNKKKPKVCEICGKEKKLELSSKNHSYSRNLDEWQWVCKLCHKEYDPKNMGYLKRKRKNGRFI